MFSLSGQNSIRIFPYLDRFSDSVLIPENTGQGKPVFQHISRSVLLNIFSHNLDLRENVSLVSARKLFMHRYMNCLTAQKLKTRKINRAKITDARSLIKLRYMLLSRLHFLMVIVELNSSECSCRIRIYFEQQFFISCKVFLNLS